MSASPPTPPGSQAHPNPPSVHTILSQQIFSSDKMNRLEVVILIILPVEARMSGDVGLLQQAASLDHDLLELCCMSCPKLDGEVKLAADQRTANLENLLK